MYNTFTSRLGWAWGVVAKQSSNAVSMIQCEPPECGWSEGNLYCKDGAVIPTCILKPPIEPQTQSQISKQS